MDDIWPRTSKHDTQVFCIILYIYRAADAEGLGSIHLSVLCALDTFYGAERARASRVGNNQQWTDSGPGVFYSVTNQIAHYHVVEN